MYIRSLLSKTCSSGIVFGKFNQIYPCTFKNLTIFNVVSYLRHVKRLGICLPCGRSHSIINIHEIVTSRWRIGRCHRRRASGVRVKRDAGHTSLSKALVSLLGSWAGLINCSISSFIHWYKSGSGMLDSFELFYLVRVV